MIDADAHEEATSAAHKLELETERLSVSKEGRKNGERRRRGPPSAIDDDVVGQRLGDDERGKDGSWR